MISILSVTHLTNIVLSFKLPSYEFDQFSLSLPTYRHSNFIVEPRFDRIVNRIIIVAFEVKKGEFLPHKNKTIQVTSVVERCHYAD